MAASRADRLRVSAPWRVLAVGLLLSGYAVAAATSAAQKSITFDELGHLTGGAAAWVTQDYRLFPQNGPLPQRWAALPLVLSGARFPSLDQPAWQTANLEAIGYQFLYGGENDHETLLWRARLAMLPLALLVGALCYGWARRLFGVGGGLVSAAVFAFSPTMLAHGTLATSDVFTALLFTASLAALWVTLHRPRALTVLASALVMGLLFVSKMSAVLMLPIALILVGVRVWLRRPLVWRGRRVRPAGRMPLLTACTAILGVHLVGIVAVIWASYGFRYTTFRDAIPGRDQQFLGETIDTISFGEIARPAIRLARDYKLLPEAYLFGLAHVFDRSDKFVGFLNGRYRVGGWWYFFGYCWLVKTPLSIMALLALAVACVWRSAARSPQRRSIQRLGYRLTPLLVVLVVYWTAASVNGLNLGERHVLPTYPALFILAGGAAGWIGRRPALSGLAVAAAVLVLAVESLAAWPHYLSYMNVLAGGPATRYRHLVDSSLDWGQDLPGLAQWLERRRAESAAPEPVFLSYFGSGNPALYGIEAMQIYSYQDWRADRPLFDLTGGIYCVSATMLQSIYTRTPGPWSVPYERAYQSARLAVDNFRHGIGEPAAGFELSAADAATWRRLASDFDELRFGRLSAFLRHRTPDESIGYSILIFWLSDQDIAVALTGPPAELSPDVGVEGLDQGQSIERLR